ncbi:MAG TPA: hypothetical protein VLA66_13050, partial [Thermoanaerobaculia bacterium]|nr:hypothetical protein [Thermoanaerobaculia bacterium]
MIVDEACPLPPSSTSAAPRAAAPLGHEALRRFHLGDPGVAPPSVPDDLLPAALAPLRGVEVRGGWPLLIDTDPQSESFARRFGDWLAESLAEDSPLAAERGRLEQRVAGRLGGAVRSAAELLSEAAGELAGEL